MSYQVKLRKVEFLEAVKRKNPLIFHVSPVYFFFNESSIIYTTEGTSNDLPEALEAKRLNPDFHGII
jgi:hypothetical protein